MVSLLPTNFDLLTQSDRLTISHSLGDFSERLTLFSNGPISYYFQGTFTDNAFTQTPQYSFTVDFTDACRSATIITAPGILDYSVVWGAISASFSEPAFTDSLDSVYPPGGICGEKIVTLDTMTTPAFLSLFPDVIDPVLNGFQISFNGSWATEADILNH